MPSLDYDRWLIKSMFWVLKNAVVWADVWELALLWCWFTWFLGRQLTNKWLFTTQNWLFRVVLVVRLLHSQFFQKKTGDHLLGSASWASNFCWIWLILKQPYSRLLFTFGLIRENPLFTICHDVIDVFRGTAIVFLKHFLRPIDRRLFLTIDKLCGNQREQICLTVKYSCNIECMYAGPTKA